MTRMPFISLVPYSGTDEHEVDGEGLLEPREGSWMIICSSPVTKSGRNATNMSGVCGCPILSSAAARPRRVNEFMSKDKLISERRCDATVALKS